ncbi:MAG TPA: GTPase [Anaerolineaceae bacterium]|nr:GTPase [Anaerolineaceae bacterium]
MQTLSDLVRKMPEDTRELFRFVWDSLPATEKKNLQTLINGIPTETNLMRMLLSMSTAQVKMSFGQKHRVAIVGPANVGKSTLYNQLVQKREDKAVVSPIPGTTRVTQFADVGLFAMIDTPGADSVGDKGLEERQRAFAAAQEADFLIIMFDAIQGIKKTEQDLFDELVHLNKPYVVVMNKMDLVRREKNVVIEQAAENLNLKPDQVIPIVAKDGKNLAPLLMAVVVTEPELMVALGQAMPAYRWQLAWRSIVSSASISAVIALTPLPVLDFGPLIITQSIMVLGIARIYNYRITLERARELVATFGLGFLGRTIFQELSKFGGIPGWILSAAVAASTTVAMGYAAVRWFETGERMSSGSLKALTKGLTSIILDSLKSLGKKKPGKENLQQRVAEALETSPAAEDRSFLDTQASGS